MTGELKTSILGSEVIKAHFGVSIQHCPQNREFGDEKLSESSETFEIDCTREFHK